MKKQIFQFENINPGSWVAMRKDTQQVVAAADTYVDLRKKVRDDSLMYLKVPPLDSSHILFTN